MQLPTLKPYTDTNNKKGSEDCILYICVYAHVCIYVCMYFVNNKTEAIKLRGEEGAWEGLRKGKHGGKRGCKVM